MRRRNVNLFFWSCQNCNGYTSTNNNRYSNINEISIVPWTKPEKLMSISTFYYWKYLYYFTLSPYFESFGGLIHLGRNVSRSFHGFVSIIFLLSSLFILKVFLYFYMFKTVSALPSDFTEYKISIRLEGVALFTFTSWSLIFDFFLIRTFLCK